MKRDIKINYGVLKEVVADVKRFQTALEDVRTANERFEAGLGNYESKAVTNLRSQYSELLKEMKSCEEELSDIHTIISDYIADMTKHINPLIENEMMRVDRNDIYWNIESMVTPWGQLALKSYERRGSDYVPWYRSQEKRARIRENMEYNYDKVDSFRRDRLAPVSQKIIEHLEEIRKIHKEKVIPYENEDDNYQKRASRLYNKYTDLWEGFADRLGKNLKELADFCIGLVKAVWDFVVGILTLAAGLVAVQAAGIVWCVTAPFSGTPKWAGDILKQAGETIGTLKYDPVLVVEGICQGASDTVEEKGIAYATGYIVGDLLVEILLTKGLGKLKAGKAAGVSDDVAAAGSLGDEIAEVGKLSDEVADAGKVADEVADAGKLADDMKINDDIDIKLSEGGSRAVLSPEMEQKILGGERIPGKNGIRGGHSPNVVNNASPDYAVEILKENADGTLYVQFYTQFPDGTVSKLKKSTLFPSSWGDEDIISSINQISKTPPVGQRTVNNINTTLHNGTINGVEIEVIVENGNITAGYPVGGKPTPGFDPIPK